jgi:hypothetical protein
MPLRMKVRVFHRLPNLNLICYCHVSLWWNRQTRRPQKAVLLKKRAGSIPASDTSLCRDILVSLLAGVARFGSIVYRIGFLVLSQATTVRFRLGSPSMAKSDSGPVCRPFKANTRVRIPPTLPLELWRNC